MARIDALRLTQFRSYDRLDLDLGGAPVVLFGANGAGKTNLLEAVSFLSPGRGLRRAKMEDVARRDGHITANAWGVTSQITTPVDTHKVAVGQVPEYPKRRTVRIDGKAASGSALSDMIKMMWLTPAQDRLFTGPASDRRRFIDRFALAHTPSHGLTSLRYEKARSERNRLLSDGITDRSWYEALETDLAAQGAQIAITRAQTLSALRMEIDARPDGAFPKARLTLDGDAEAMAFDGASVDDIENTLKERLEADRGLDMRAGRTLKGVHRSELIVTYIDKNMPAAECSTGEQKALLIGLILAHARAQKDHQPILLLDEIAAHLDEGRRAAMIEELLELGTQAFLTGTDAALFTAFEGRAEMFEVKDGTLNRV